MLKVSRSQADRMTQGDPRQLIDGILHHVLSEYPSRLPEPMLRRMVSNGVDKARSFDLHNNAELFAFVSLMFAFAPNFADHPEFVAVLTQDRSSPEQRWEQIFTARYDHVWEEVAAPEFYGEAAWFSAEEGGVGRGN